MPSLHASAALLLLLAPATASADWRGAEASVARRLPLPVITTQAETIRRALREAERQHERHVSHWLRLCRVPAPPGEESARAALFADLLREAGLQAKVLADGNVEAVLPGSGSGAPAVLSAHLDALHVPSRENPVRREGDLVQGPGVLDDGSGLAALLATARILSTVGYRPEREIRFLATVSEERGLAGARSYMASAQRPAAFVSIDGILGAVDYGATGITWRRYTYTGRGGHTLLSARTPSPAFAAGRAIAALADLAAATDDPINVSVLRGGDVPNAIPYEVSFTVDARSEDPTRLAQLERDVARLAQAAANREGVLLREDSLQSLPAARLPGHARSPLVTGTVAILEWLDLPASTFPRGSSDHNIALLEGIPAIAVGATVGRHAHSPRESADVALLEKGVKQCLLIAVLLGEGLRPDGAPAAQ